MPVALALLAAATLSGGAPPPLSEDAKLEADVMRDIELGKKYSAEADKELKPSDDPVRIERVKRIFDEMAAIANVVHAKATWGDKRFAKFPYTVKVVKGKDVNAFSIPGGFIYVYEGLVDFAESDDELAGVIGHEIAHASFRHVATLQREQSKLQAYTLPLILIGILTGGAAGGFGAMQAGNLVGTAIGSGWSVRAEEAADYGGFQYIIRSKYNPTGILTFMERLAVEESRRPQIDWGIYRTHPPGRERAESLTEYLEGARIPIQRSVVTTTWRVTAKPDNNGGYELRFGTRPIATLAGPGAEARASAAVARINGFFDLCPEMFMVSTKGDGTILGKRAPILELTPDDARAAGKTLPELRAQTMKNISGALYGLSFHIWEIR